jgi:hypothetical protein
MKQIKHLINTIFFARGSIATLVLILSTIAIAQESTPPDEFPVGTSIAHELLAYPDIFNAFVETGMNTIHQRADNDTKPFLTNLNLVAYNQDTLEYIYHYSTSYYSKWEAEKNVDSNRVGIKHRDRIGTVFGDTATWKNKLCWSTKGLSAPACSLMYGPHYRQEKRYKRWHYGCTSGPGCLTYTPRFRMALDNYGGANPNEDVCVIKVVFRYKDNDEIGAHHDTTFIARTLKVGDFDTTGKFDDFYLHPNPLFRIYEYYPNFILPSKLSQMVGSEPQVNYIDWEEYTGIQFWVDWLRTDTLCTLYIDYAEVYDNAGGNDLFEDSVTAAYTYQKIKDYAQSFSDWENIKFWGGTDEPYSIDCYTPIHIVDSLIQSVQAPPLVVNFQPSWWHTLNINGEDEIEMFYNIAKPEKITLSVNPCQEA